MTDKALVKVMLSNQGEDIETPWAEDLGPSADGRGRRVRLDNVPFFHAKPTFGDVIVAEPDADGFLCWDSSGVPFEEIDSRIEEDGGRFAMIVDYRPSPGSDVDAAFRALERAARAIDVVPEGCFGPRDGRPGRIYLAVPETTAVEVVFTALQDAHPTVEVVLVHPVPDDEQEGDSH